MSRTIIAATFVLLLIAFISVVDAQSSVTREEALSAIQQAESDIQEMQNAGFPVEASKDILTAARQALERAGFAEALRSGATGELAEEARKALEGLNYQGFTYEDVLGHTNEIASRKQKAYILSDSIRVMEIRIGDYRNQKIDVAEAGRILADAKSAFEKERYDETGILLLNVRAELEEKRAEYSTLNVVVGAGRSYVEDNWVGISIAAAAIGLSSWFAWKRVRTRRVRERLRKLKTEKKVLVRLMKKAQVERFETAEISESVYEIRMEKYNERLDEVKSTIPTLEAMVKEEKLDSYIDKIIKRVAPHREGRKAEKSVEKKTPAVKKERVEKKAKKPREPFWSGYLKIFNASAKKRMAGKKVPKRKAVGKKAGPILVEAEAKPKVEKPRPDILGGMKRGLQRMIMEGAPKPRAEPRTGKARVPTEEKTGAEPGEETKERISQFRGSARVEEFERAEEKAELVPRPGPMRDLVDRWKVGAAKMKHEAQRRGALEKLRRDKGGYSFSEKGYKRSDLGLKLKRLIGKIRFKIS